MGSVPSIINSNFNPSWPVKLFHGGWSGNCQNDKTSFSLRNGRPILKLNSLGLKNEQILIYFGRLFKKGQLQLYRRLVAMRSGHRGRYLHRYSRRWQKHCVSLHSSISECLHEFSLLFCTNRQLIKFLMDVTGVPLNSFHVIGLSAGAHAAGSVGFNFNVLFNYNLQLPRITGINSDKVLNSIRFINSKNEKQDWIRRVIGNSIC